MGAERQGRGLALRRQNSAKSAPPRDRLAADFRARTPKTPAPNAPKSAPKTPPNPIPIDNRSLSMVRTPKLGGVRVTEVISYFTSLDYHISDRIIKYVIVATAALSMRRSGHPRKLAFPVRAIVHWRIGEEIPMGEILERPQAPARHRLDVDAYYKMAEAGILTREDRVELIDGEIIDMNAIGSPHAAIMNAAQPAVCPRRGRGNRPCRRPRPVRLDSYNEPEPDLMLLRPRADDYQANHPGAADVLLLIEVSDSSLAYDRGRKLALYAKFGVAEVWIVDLAGAAVEIYRGPKDGAYASTGAPDRRIAHAEPRPKRRDRRRRAARVTPASPLGGASIGRCRVPLWARSPPPRMRSPASMSA